MGDLVVRQPHLGRETTALLCRIVDSDEGGVPQDHIEPYLLVRLLRCGYVRRKEPESPFFVATPAGTERSRFENLLAKQRREEFERREIIRGRVQTMLDRLELDRVPMPAAPSLRDLPLYRERPLPFLRDPPRPVTHARALAAPDIANRVNAGMRDTPADVLRAIREAEIRARRALPMPEASQPPIPQAGSAAIVHLGRLPEPRSAAAHETSFASAPGETLPPVVVTDVTDPWMDAETLNVPGLNFHHAADRGAPWSRAALAATVAAAVLLMADPRHRPEAPSVERPARVSLAQAQAPALRHSPPAPPILLTADTNAAKQARAAAARAVTHSIDAKAPKVAQSVAPSDQPHLVLGRPATLPNQVAMAQRQRTNTSPGITPVVAATAKPTPAPTLAVASASTAAAVSEHANTPPTNTAVVAATAKPGPAPTLSIASTSTAAAPSPIPTASAMRPALIRAAATQAAASSSVPVTPAAREPMQVATAPAEAVPPLVPPLPPPSLVPAVAIVALPLVAEPSEPADPTPRDAVLAQRPDHARAAMHLEHEPALADAEADGRGRVLAETEARPDTHVISQDDALTRVAARLHAAKKSGDAMVDRLNKLSLEAARRNQVFIPPGAARRVTPPKRPRALVLP